MINWDKIDTVLLDMDGTLLDLSFDNFFWREYLPREYAKLAKLPLAEAREQLEALSASLYGSLEWYCVDYWSDYLHIDIESIKKQVSKHIRYRPHALPFLKFLRQLNKQCILVTNAHPKTLELKIASTDLREYLDKLISSHEFSLAKENEGFWHKLKDRENLDLSRCLFIDDSTPVLARAVEEGVSYILQILQPDTTQAPNIKGDFFAIYDFDELMSAHGR
jgi:HAD superfamily hydrolase (TIGR01509 family)